MQGPTYHYDVLDYRVIDGDTIECVLDLGFNTQRKEVFRLKGIDCPEQNTEAGKIATGFLMSRLIEAQVVEAPITIVSTKFGKFRWLGTLYIDGVDMNEVMVEQGHAVRYLA